VEEIPVVDAVAGAQRVDDGAYLLDVRTPDEWVAGHAPGANHVPLDELEARVADVPRDRAVVAICRSGARSGKATEFLLAQGYDAVNLAGGMRAWAASGLPMISESGDPPRVA
jgi:rhodanese-related sulfurtransferase